MVRSAEEWKTHPQAAAIASLPLLEIEKIGDAPFEPLPKGDRPLSGIRVVDITRVLAGPTCARTLAEHGADVMKITAAHLPNLGYQEWDTGHGKLSAQLDRAIETITPSRRPVVRMYLAGYSSDEVGKVMGWSEAKTRNLLYRGLADLRERLGRIVVGYTSSHKPILASELKAHWQAGAGNGKRIRRSAGAPSS